MEKKTISVTLWVLVLASTALAQRTGGGRAEFFDSTAINDALRLSMTGVSSPATGKTYVAWLVSDDDVQCLKLGELTVQGSGTVSFLYKDNSNNNLLASNKKFLITEEVLPFSGSSPNLLSSVFVDSLSGPGIPAPTSPLTRLRNCLVSFTNTAQGLGLAVWLKKQIPGYVEHAGLAKNEALAGNVGGTRTHTDHVFDFIRGKLSGLVSGNSSVATNGDPLGYGYRRYGDLGTMDSAQGGAGPLGGAGYCVSSIVADPTATPQMKQAGGRALVALQHAFGQANDSGLAKVVTDRALNIINGVYAAGTLQLEGQTFYNLALQFINGTVGANDTAAATGGIVQSYYHIQQMATFVLAAPLQPTSAGRAESALPDRLDVMQNYPNPFNGVTTISFRLPFSAQVRLTIYDVLGQQIDRPVADKQFEAGSHSVTWNSGDAVSGIYFCEFAATALKGKELTTKILQMILIK